MAFSVLDGGLCNIDGVYLTHLEHGNIELRSHRFQLFYRRWTVDVASDQKRPLAALLHKPGELCPVGCFAGALKSHEHNDARRLGGNIELHVFAAHQRRKLLVDYFDYHLRRGKALHNVLSHRAVAHIFDKVLDHLVADVGLKKSKPHLAHGCGALALKRNMNSELVVSPYSCFLALCCGVKDVVSNLKRFELLGMDGKYGFWEAMDFTGSRTNGNNGEIVSCVMAHHLGMALLRENRSDEAMEIIEALLPGSRDQKNYEAEPYVLAADISGNPDCIGKAGWSWYTGSAGWFFRVITEELLGIRLRDGVISLSPRLPSNWDECSVVIRDKNGKENEFILKREISSSGGDDPYRRNGRI